MSYPPYYPGVDTYDQPLVDAWWTPGWNAQTKDYLVAPTLTGTFPGAPPVNYLVVTHGYYDDDGSPLPGFLTFLPSDNVTFTSGSSTWRIPARLSGTTTLSPQFTGFQWQQDASGSIYLYQGMLYVRLMCTDTSGIVTDSGDPLTYTVIEHFLGGQKFSVTTPSADVATEPIDLYSLMVTGSNTPYPFDPTNVLLDESPLTTPLVPSAWGTGGDIDGGGA